MTKEKMNIIKLESDTSGYGHGYYDNVYFFDSFNIGELLKTAEDILDAHGEVLSLEKTFEKWMRAKGNEDEVMQVLYEDMQSYNDNYNTVEDFKEDFTAVEYIDGSWEDYLPELLDIRHNNELEEFFSYAGLDFGTVGHSPWSFYLSKGHDYSMIRDIYEDWNFYTVTFIQDGEEVDSYHSIYIRDTDELRQIVKDVFDVREFYLVDNYEGASFDVLSVEEIIESTYSYKVKHSSSALWAAI